MRVTCGGAYGKYGPRYSGPPRHYQPDPDLPHRMLGNLVDILVDMAILGHDSGPYWQSQVDFIAKWCNRHGK